MAVIDVEALSAELSPDSPCGEDLEYDPVLANLEIALQGKPEQVMGDNVIEAEPANWKEVKKLSLDLLSRTRDIRFTLYLARALVNTDGLIAFNEGLQLLKGILEQYWDEVHPVLDPEDDNDPTMRVNALIALCDKDGFIKEIEHAPLVTSKVLGSFSLHDIHIVNGTVAPPKTDKPLPEASHIDGAFMEAEIEELTAMSEAVASAVENVKAIEALVTEKIGSSQAPSLESCVKCLDDISKEMSQRLSLRGVNVEGEEEAEGGGAPAQQRIAGEISCREDVVRTLEKICEYYHRSEPSSPVPLLLQRAKKMVTMNFVDIVKDMAPAGIGEVTTIVGNSESS